MSLNAPKNDEPEQIGDVDREWLQMKAAWQTLLCPAVETFCGVMRSQLMNAQFRITADLTLLRTSFEDLAAISTRIRSALLENRLTSSNYSSSHDLEDFVKTLASVREQWDMVISAAPDKSLDWSRFVQEQEQILSRIEHITLEVCGWGIDSET